MAVAFRSQTEAHGTGGNQVINKPAGTVDGDVLIAVVINYNGGTHDLASAPAGFTQLLTTQQWRNSDDSKARVYWKVASSEGASYTFTGNGGTSPTWEVYMSAYSGVGDTPINQSSVLKTSNPYTQIQGTSVTPSVDNCLIVSIALCRKNAATTDITPPSGYTNEWEFADATFSSRDESADLLQTSAAATGALTWTTITSGAGESSLVYIIALAPPGNVDAATERVAITPSGVEDALLGSRGTEDFKFTASAVDVLFADTGTEGLALTASGSDVEDMHESATESYKLTPSGIEPQFGLVEATTVPFHYTPSGLDVLGKEYSDVATETLRLLVTTHECYAIATPKYELTLEKRWNMQTPFATWEVGSLTKRWNVFAVTAGFEIPC